MKRGRKNENTASFSQRKRPDVSDAVILAYFDACRDGNLNEVRETLRNVDNVVRMYDVFGKYGLHWAAENGHVEIVKLLIQNDADVNAVNYEKSTALHLAAGYGHIEAVKVLLENGADVNSVMRYEESPIHRAAEGGHVDVAIVLLENGADVNAVMYSQRSVLHVAAEGGHVDVAIVLLENGADVNAVTTHKSTALHFAAREGHVDVGKVLLQNGSDINAFAKVMASNTSVLNLASSNNHVSFVLLLLCFGAEINEYAIAYDATGLLRPINDRVTLLRAGKGMGTTLMSNEEKQFMWNLAFFFTIKHRVAAFKAYYAIRSFITFNGIFMGPGYSLGDGSVWRRRVCYRCC